MKLSIYIEYIICAYPNQSCICRLFTGAKDTSIFTHLSSETYKKIMRNNIDLETSFNPTEVSIQKVLREPKTALIQFEVNVPAKYGCMVRPI